MRIENNQINGKSSGIFVDGTAVKNFVITGCVFSDVIERPIYFQKRKRKKEDLIKKRRSNRLTS